MLTKILILGLFYTLVTATYTWEKEEQHHAPQPYRFGYEVKDKEGSQYRHEEADGHGTVKGSYGYTDEKGVYREVHYVADKNGFRAKVKTNEPGTGNQDPADVKVEANPQIQQLHGVKVLPEIVPVYHKVEVAPIQPVKHYHQLNTNNFNKHSFSPLHGFRYESVPGHNFKSVFNVHNTYKNDNEKHLGGYKFHVPHYRKYQRLNDFGNVNEYKFSNEEIEKIIEEMKNNGKYTDHFDGYSNDGEIERIIEELKNKGRYSGNFKGLNNNDDFQFHEFRDLNLNKHKSLFSKDSLNDGYDNRY